MTEADLEIIEAYLDGLLDADERHAFDRRLAEAGFRQAVADARVMREALRLAKPAVPSEKMWKAIQAQLGQQSSGASRWTNWLTRTWSWPLRGALAGGLAAMAVLVLQPWKTGGPELQPEMAAPEPSQGQGAQAGSAPATLSEAKAEASAAPRAAAAGGMLAEKAPAAPASADAEPQPSKKSMDRPEAAAAAPVAKTEVERALEATELDGMIQEIIEQQARQPRPASGAVMALRNGSPELERATVNSGAGARLTSAMAPASPAERADSAVAAETVPQGGIDAQGFWDWRPAALALNRRQWAQAQADLGLAQANAPEAAERAFAASALSLLSSGSGPLTAPTFAAQPGLLLVQQAGRWQLLVERRRAVYTQGVIARIPGWRTQGDTLLLDLSLDRGDFSPGTRFTRLADDHAVSLFNAQGQAVSGEEVLAPQGASYSVGKKELHLR